VNNAQKQTSGGIATNCEKSQWGWAVYQRFCNAAHPSNWRSASL